MSKIGVGIIGTGSIVNTYKKCIEELNDVSLVALYTKSSQRIEEAEAEFGVRVLADLEEFMAIEEIDLVCVCNESGRHGDAIKAAAKVGKHVLCEKPLEVTTEKIDELLEFSEKQGIKLGCVLQNRCSEAYRIVENTVKSGKLGKLLMGNAHINWYRPQDYYAHSDWRGTLEYDGGAALMNQGIHTIDLLINLMGDVKSVFGSVRTLIHDIEGEDVGIGLLHFENGAIGSITGGTALYPGYPEKVEIYGEKGSILMEGGTIKQWNVKEVPAPNFDVDKNDGSGSSDPTAIGHQHHKAVITDMIEAIDDMHPPMVEGKEARKAVAVITAIYKSSENEKMIYL
ncbi:Gfo/Idh/MocA family protein [Pareuzebyella sediminis]|uniref:Gfo/Idh/MocA family protein n=1 Tax=Pareuzebyella sediminis TaxID=2607998 RepID=UPI0011EDCE7C|nr:Gfo/Idh/MocA family oxidoreductase [Pareuzebyella sediminis]